jgi:hypothetical protein
MLTLMAWLFLTPKSKFSFGTETLNAVTLAITSKVQNNA